MARHVSLDAKDEETNDNKFIPIADHFEEVGVGNSVGFLHSEGFGIVNDEEENDPQNLNSDKNLIASNPPILMKLGGCADPSLIVGSICDSQYIPTKMSKVGKTIAPSYGHVGETFEIGAVSRCGVRDSNEDAYLILFDLLGPVSFDPSESLFSKFATHSLFAIFDGHCGNHAARYAAEKFHDILMDESRNVEHDPNKTTEDTLYFLLSRSIDRLDKDFCHFCTQDGREWFSGSTAIISLMVDDHVAVAGVGDASGVICCTTSSPLSQLRSDGWIVLDPEDEGLLPSDGLDIDNDSVAKYTVYKEVADAHSPSHPDEKNRIEAANGWITYETEIPLISQFHRMNWADKDVLDIFQRCFSERFSEHHSNPSRILKISRVCGDLAVSRALGDREYKAAFNKDSSDTTLQENEWRSPAPMPFYEYNMQKGEEHNGLFTGDLVISTPGLKFFRVGTHGVDEFMLMACDGLWDVIDHDEAVRVTRNLLFQIKLSAEECAERLAELAGGLGSSDNITIIVVKFQNNE
jgi:serine/threonine protein phosphatase PrpC